MVSDTSVVLGAITGTGGQWLHVVYPGNLECDPVIPPLRTGMLVPAMAFSRTVTQSSDASLWIYSSIASCVVDIPPLTGTKNKERTSFLTSMGFFGSTGLD